MLFFSLVFVKALKVWRCSLARHIPCNFLQMHSCISRVTLIRIYCPLNLSIVEWIRFHRFLLSNRAMMPNIFTLFLFGQWNVSTKQTSLWLSIQSTPLVSFANLVFFIIDFSYWLSGKNVCHDWFLVFLTNSHWSPACPWSVFYSFHRLTSA